MGSRPASPTPRGQTRVGTPGRARTVAGGAGPSQGTAYNSNMEILTEKEGGVLRIEISRPEKKNAITAAMYQVMARALADGEADPAGTRVPHPR